MYWKTSGEMKEMWKQKWHELIKKIGRKLDESKTERLTTDSRKNSLTGNKGTMISDCFVYMENDQDTWKIYEIGRIELQESKINKGKIK